MNINDVFTLDQYDEAYDFVQTHEYTTIEYLGEDKYKIVQLPVPTPEEIEKQEQERIARLYLTAADVERGIFKARGLDFEDIIAMVENISPAQVKALKIELKANNFYRGNPYVNMIGQMLGFTTEQLNNFFETNNYKALL